MNNATATRFENASRRSALNTLASVCGVGNQSTQNNRSMRRAGKASIDTSLSDFSSRLPLRGHPPPLPRRHPAQSTSASAPPGAVTWLTRATFGFSQSDLNTFNALGANDGARWTAWTQAQLNPVGLKDADCDSRIAAANFQTLSLPDTELWARYQSASAQSQSYDDRMLPAAETERMTLIRQIYSTRQVFEVMVDFWHDHFSVFGWDYDAGPMFPALDALLRDTSSGHGVFGNFLNLLMGAGKSASMMYMLDLYSSTSAGPNENYARELCELHALGAENYSGVVDPDANSGNYNLPTGNAADGSPIRLQYVDNDVYAATTALTGWTISQSTWQTQNDANAGAFEFVDSLHYNKVPTSFLNRYIGANTHQQAGADVFNWLAAHPGAAHFIAGKLCKRLVSDAPPAALVENIASIFLKNYQAPNQLQLVTAAILQSTEFQQSWGRKMKRPAVAFASALRALDADFRPAPDNGDWSTTDALMYSLQQAGHRLFYCATPNGYADTQVAWSSTGALGMSLNLITQLVEARQDRSKDDSPFLADVQGQTLAAFADEEKRTASNISGFWCDKILGYRPDNVYNAAIELLRQNAQADAALDLSTDEWHSDDLSRHYTQSRLRSAVALILCSPDFLIR